MLQEDLVNTCHLGDRITVVGFFRSHALDAHGNQQKGHELYFYVEAVSVVVRDCVRRAEIADQPSCIPRLQEGHGFSRKELDFVRAFHQQCASRQLKYGFILSSEFRCWNCCGRSLVHSFCPEIYGNELVKAGILLALMGGTRRQKDSLQTNPLHVLIVADPGMGKRTLLQVHLIYLP